MSQPLPIDLLKADLVAACGRTRRLVLRAPTGSGKSTRIPQMLLDLGLVEGQIVVLQPRRIAARLLAARIAQERGGKLGAEVGYQIRFERDSISAETRSTLESMGHRGFVEAGFAYGDANSIVVQDGQIEATSDPRSAGGAAAY